MTNQTVTLPTAVVRKDQRYEMEVSRLIGQAQNASEKAEEISYLRDQQRYEWCNCPNGPRLTQRDYAEQVGVAHTTIGRSIRAYTDAQNLVHGAPDHADLIECAYGKDHDPRHEAKKPTTAQKKAHKKAKTRLKTNERLDYALDVIAQLWKVQRTSLRGNAPKFVPIIDAIKARMRDEIEDDLDAEETKTAIAQIVTEEHREFKAKEARVGSVRRWMAANRGLLRDDEVTMTEARTMVDRIYRTMERKSISWRSAESENKEWDAKRTAAERTSNELARMARLAVQDLRLQASRVKDAALLAAKAQRRIEDDEVPMSEDEVTLVIDDLTSAYTAIGLALASVRGDSGTDWDAELASLEGGH